MKKTYGYARVSSKEQNLDRQIQALKEYNVNERDIVTDKQSGKDFNREGYNTLKNSLLREGDILVIKELDRLGRNMDQIKKEWHDLERLGINIVVIDNPILNTAGKTDLEKKLISNIVFELLSYMAQKERDKIRQRQREGIKAAKEKGKHLGRPKAEYPSNWNEVYEGWSKGKYTGVKAMELLDLKKNTFYKLVHDYEVPKVIKVIGEEKLKILTREELDAIKIIERGYDNFNEYKLKRHLLGTITNLKNSKPSDTSKNKINLYNNILSKLE